MPRSPSNEDILVGRIALASGLLSRDKLDECLDEQLRLEKGGKARQLGEIMVDKGYLRLGDVTRLLRIQKKVVMKCPNCEATYTVSEELAKKRLPCQRCKAPLVPVKRLVT